MDIENELRRVFRREKLSEYRLAKDANVVVAVVQRWNAGGGLRVVTAEKIAKALGCELSVTPMKQARKG